MTSGRTRYSTVLAHAPFPLALLWRLASPRRHVTSTNKVERISFERRATDASARARERGEGRRGGRGRGCGHAASRRGPAADLRADSVTRTDPYSSAQRARPWFKECGIRCQPSRSGRDETRRRRGRFFSRSEKDVGAALSLRHRTREVGRAPHLG